VKSLYGAAFAYAGLALYEASGELSDKDLAMAEYDWIETNLKRPDNLYWCESSAGPPADPRNPAGPIGRIAPGKFTRRAASPIWAETWPWARAMPRSIN
jgi:hypothetical protein